MTTLRTAVDLTPTRRSVDMFAGKALLRAVGGPYKSNGTTGPAQLVTEHPLEHRPSCIRDSTSAVPAHHPRDVQVLQYDDAVTLGVPCGFLVREVMTLSSDLAVFPHDTTIRLLSVLGSFLSTGGSALRPPKLFQRSFQILRAGNQLPIRSACKVADAAIDCDRWPSAWYRIGLLDHAKNRDEPLISVADERAALGRTVQRTMDDGTDRPELREVQLRTIKLPNLGMRFAQVDDVDTLPLPARCFCKFLETSLPCFIELVQKLHRHIAWNIREPRQLGTKSRQVLRLIKRSQIAALAAFSRQSEEPLLVREVPQEPQRITPPICGSDLLLRRIDAVAEGFADQHLVLRSMRVRQTTRRGFLPALNGGTSALGIK